MTRPSEVKPREGEQPGTLAADYKAGAILPRLAFTVTPDIVDEYIAAIDSDKSIYKLNGRPVAPPNVLAVYQLAVLYCLYPPIQGIILTDQEWHWHSPIWADEDTEIEADGKVTEKFEKRGKTFVRWSAEFRRKDGTPIATSTNTMFVPELGE
ncbi:MAG: MaoC family dehydratase [Casimicrobiaceae bacterium]